MSQLAKIRRFQKIGFSLVYPFVMYLMVQGILSRFKSMMYHKTWDISPTMTVLWMIGYIAWSSTMASFFYGFPVVVSIVTYYLWLKLNTIKEGLDYLNDTIRHNGSQDSDNPSRKLCLSFYLQLKK